MFGSFFKLDDDQNAKGFYTTNHKGTRVALGVGSNTNGQDADIVIADDILDYDDAKSATARENVIDYWSGTLSQRLALGSGKDRIVHCGHRVHEDDTFDHIWQTHGNSGEWSLSCPPGRSQSNCHQQLL